MSCYLSCCLSLNIHFWKLLPLNSEISLVDFLNAEVGELIMRSYKGTLLVGVDLLNDLVVDFPIQQIEDLYTGVTTIGQGI